MAYNPNEPRDAEGKWTSFEGSAAIKKAASDSDLRDVETTAKALEKVPQEELIKIANENNILVHNYSTVIKQGHTGLFLTSAGNGNEYGEKTAFFEINKNAVGIKIDNSYNYLEKNGLINNIVKVDKANLYGATQNIPDIVEMPLSKTYDYTNDYGQLAMIKDLKEKGKKFDYVEYHYESYSADFPEYQIINKNAVTKVGDTIHEAISVSYHKAKKNGSNNKLVKAVEEVLK